MFGVKRVLLGGIALAFLSACGGASFAESDPKGYEACSEWAGYQSKGDVISKVGGDLAVAELARKSASKAIRGSVTNLIDDENVEAAGQQFGLLDHDKFRAACEAEGFEF